MVIIEDYSEQRAISVKSCSHYRQRLTEVTATTVGRRPEANNMISIHTHSWQNHYHCAKPKSPLSGDWLKRQAIVIQMYPTCVCGHEEKMGKVFTQTCTAHLCITKKKMAQKHLIFGSLYKDLPLMLQVFLCCGDVQQSSKKVPHVINTTSSKCGCCNLWYRQMSILTTRWLKGDATK